jgi:hypothetical protein
MTDETLNLHILRTKLNRSAVDGKWVQCARLAARFDEAWKNSLIS